LTSDSKDAVRSISRREWLGGAVVAAVGALPREARAADEELWQLWVRYVTGGVAYRPSLPSMFLDPMFAEMAVIPSDLPLGSYTGYNPLSLIPVPQNQPVPPGRGGFGNAPPILANNPPDAPWIPSSQLKTGVRALMPGNNPVYNVLLLNDQTDWPEAARDTMEKSVAAAKGIVILHHALGDNQTWPWWREQVAGGQLVLQDRDGMKKSTVTRGVSFDARPAGDHPIVRNLGPLRFTGEAAFKGMWQSPKITPLLETNHPASDRVVAWIGPHPSARVVCIQPGDAPETHRDPAFRRLVRNALLWAGGRLG
jgi:hypothetical protein